MENVVVNPSSTTNIDNFIDRFKDFNADQQAKILANNGSAKITKSSRKRKTYTDDFKEKAVNLWKTNRNYPVTAEELSKDQKESKIYDSHVRR